MRTVYILLLLFLLIKCLGGSILPIGIKPPKKQDAKNNYFIIYFPLINSFKYSSKKYIFKRNYYIFGLSFIDQTVFPETFKNLRPVCINENNSFFFEKSLNQEFFDEKHICCYKFPFSKFELYLSLIYPYDNKDKWFDTYVSFGKKLNVNLSPNRSLRMIIDPNDFENVQIKEIPTPATGSCVYSNRKKEDYKDISEPNDDIDEKQQRDKETNQDEIYEELE